MVVQWIFLPCLTRGSYFQSHCRVIVANIQLFRIKFPFAIPDLNHNIARGEAGGHNELVRKHRTALALVKKGLGMLMEAVDDIEKENGQEEE